MQEIIKQILRDSVLEEEIASDYYFAKCYVISKSKLCYEIQADTKIDFEVAAVAFIGKNDNIVYMLATNTLYRNKGYASQLMTLLKQLRSTLILTVRVSNEIAIRVYEKMGFVKTRLMVNFYAYTSKNEDAYEMKWVNEYKIDTCNLS